MSARPAAKLRLALLPGDGIGPEVIAVASRVLEHLFADGSCGEGEPLELVELDAGWRVFEATGRALPAATLGVLRACDGALFGAVASPSRSVPGYRSPIVDLRRELDLFANLRPAVSAPVPGVKPGIDLLIVRENTEGLYGAPERWVQGGNGSGGNGGTDDGDAVITERRISRRASGRIAGMAFEAAHQRGESSGRRGKVTIVHKANVLRASDGLFRETALGVGGSYPTVDVEELLVDAAAYHLVRTPERFDVLVAPNLYGDILSDVAAALVGGLGLVPSLNRGESFVLAEPVHGSAPDLVGRGLANPVATLRAAVMLLETLERKGPAAALSAAVEASLAAGVRTPDLGGAYTTAEVEADILRRLSPPPPPPPSALDPAVRMEALSPAYRLL